MNTRGGGIAPMRAELSRPKLVHMGWWWFIAAMAGVSLGLWWWSRDLQRQLDELQRQSAAWESARAAAASAPAVAAPAPPKPYDASAREMLKQTTTDWPAALSAIESVQLPGVRVLSFDFSASDARVAVVLHLAEQRQAVEYVNELNTGLPAEGLAWRWTLSRVEVDRSAGAARAELTGLWRSK